MMDHGGTRERLVEYDRYCSLERERMSTQEGGLGSAGLLRSSRKVGIGGEGRSVSDV